MAFKLNFEKHSLQFKFDAKTSRGSLRQHIAYLLKLSDTTFPEISGTGEAAPLAGLSPDYGPGFEEIIEKLCHDFNQQEFNAMAEVIQWKDNLNLAELPALNFGLETAILDYENGGNKLLYDSAFSRGEAGIPINGLIWMGNKTFMQEQISQKLKAGFSCLKLKIGGLDFDTECAILASVREVASAENLTIRVDANGAFSPETALQKLEKLARFTIHSIEQPIKPSQHPEMRLLCENSPIPIALDEEQIGVNGFENRQQLLEAIRPAYLILKPTLTGGLQETKNWISLAEKNGIKWWLTSALESNIGLNAIAQFTATFPGLIPQSLGTGQLYHNNIASPLEVKQGFLYYVKDQPWQAV